MKSLEGKIALVTGSSKGIGAGIAKCLGAEGATVVVNYATSREGADRTVAEITKSGGQAWSVQGDFSKPEEDKNHILRPGLSVEPTVRVKGG